MSSKSTVFALTQVERADCQLLEQKTAGMLKEKNEAKRLKKYFRKKLNFICMTWFVKLLPQKLHYRYKAELNSFLPMHVGVAMATLKRAV